MGSPAVVLLSGGLDSTVLLHYVAKRLKRTPVFALSFRYGQKHDRELAMARWQASQLPEVAEHIELDIGFFQELVGGSAALVHGGPEIPDLSALRDGERDQPPTYVPNRNMVLLALAASCAEGRGCEDVYYGAQAQDEYGYWDCTPDFVKALNQVLALNRRDAVQILAPFAHRRKADGVRLGIELGVDFAHTWSCYRGGAFPCETCPTCVERHHAFAEVGVADPLGSAP